jgi:hypothetical protein
MARRMALRTSLVTGPWASFGVSAPEPRAIHSWLKDGKVPTVTPVCPLSVPAVTGLSCMAMLASPLCRACAWLAEVVVCFMTTRVKYGLGPQ